MAEKTKKFGDKLFTCITFGGDKQYDLLPDTLDLVRGPLGGMLGTLKNFASSELAESMKTGEKVDMTQLDMGQIADLLEPEVISNTLRDVAQELRGNGKDLIKELLTNVTVQVGGKAYDARLDFDTVFECDLWTMIKVVFWVIQLNYAPFLPSLNAK